MLTRFSALLALSIFATASPLLAAEEPTAEHLALAEQAARAQATWEAEKVAFTFWAGATFGTSTTVSRDDVVAVREILLRHGYFDKLARALAQAYTVEELPQVIAYQDSTAFPLFSRFSLVDQELAMCAFMRCKIDTPSTYPYEQGTYALPDEAKVSKILGYYSSGPESTKPGQPQEAQTEASHTSYTLWASFLTAAEADLLVEFIDTEVASLVIRGRNHPALRDFSTNDVKDVDGLYAEMLVALCKNPAAERYCRGLPQRSSR